ncbi:MAG: hypothetical protein KC983_06365 [Phycisphaerales bacterium]|nr:hypothetical protein [Phycisphaerales bacterium]
MRVDHFAYQRATRVASFGLAVQFVIALTLFLFSRFAGDTAFQFASYYAAIGVLLWLGLIIVFHQHKLERLEALEEDELAATRSGGSSVFDADDFGVRVAARRLRAMHNWLMPIISVVIAILLAGIATLMLRWMSSLDDVETINEFARTEYLGWAVSICLAFAAMAFIISRFIAGMAKQTGWQNLRGGAAYMVGNALVMIAVAVGIIFRFFNNDAVIEAIGYAIPVFMIVYAAEILLNLLLNFYRPRVPGEVPRPAFDSKVLSLFAAPDNLVRSINEAINYQFGFDVTSTWGYQLLLRSFGALIVIGVVVLVLLNTMVIVEPHQQAIRLRGGAIIGDAGEQVHDAGLMWKWPWPYETAEIYDVDRIRSLSITARRTRELQLNLWSEDLDGKTDVPLEPFIVKAARESSAADTNAALAAMNLAGRPGDPGHDDTASQKVSEQLALVDLEISLEYRIRRDNNGLLDYLMFGSDQVARRQRFNERERMIRIVTEAVVTQHIVSLPLDDVLEQQGGQLARTLQTKLQERLDDPAVKAGVEVVAINLMLVRPSTGRVAQAFEELPISRQAREQRTAEARQRVASDTATAIGDITRLDVLLTKIDEYDALRNDRSPRGENESQAAFDRRQAERAAGLERLRREIESRILQGGGSAAQVIANAQTNRWIRVIDQRARAERVRSELASYKAAPRLFREMRIMAVYGRVLQNIDKYIVGVDAENIAIDVDFPKLDPLLNFTDSQGEDPEN